MKRLVRSMVLCGAMALFAVSPALGYEGNRNGHDRHDWSSRKFDDRDRGHNDRDHRAGYREIEHQARYQRPYRPSYQHYRPSAPSGWSSYWNGPRGSSFWFFYGR